VGHGVFVTSEARHKHTPLLYSMKQISFYVYYTHIVQYVYFLYNDQKNDLTG